MYISEVVIDYKTGCRRKHVSESARCSVVSTMQTSFQQLQQWTDLKQHANKLFKDQGNDLRSLGQPFTSTSILQFWFPT